MEKANIRRKRTFRGFKASPWTDALLNISKNVAEADSNTQSTKSCAKTQHRLCHVANEVEGPDDRAKGAAPTHSTSNARWEPEARQIWMMEVKARSRSNRLVPVIQNEGPKTGPFNPLPIESKGQVPNAFEFFRNVYAPIYAQSPGFRTCCQVMLQDAMLFEQMMGYVLVMQHMNKSPECRMSTPSLYHSNRSVMRLRQRLQSVDTDERTSDAVVMTILFLIAFYVTCGDFEPWSLHMKALRRITAVRGGLDKLGWEGFLATKVAQVEAAWSTFETRKIVDPHVESGLVYPEHPFDPSLCSQIAKFSTGFRELALQKRLCLQFIRTLEEVLRRMEDANNAPSAVAITSVMDSVICKPELTTLERVLAIAVISCCVFRARKREGVPPTVEIGIQLHARSFPQGRELYYGDAPQENALDWAALALKSTADKGTTAWTWANRRIITGNANLLEAERCKLEKKFLNIPV